MLEPVYICAVRVIVILFLHAPRPTRVSVVDVGKKFGWSENQVHKAVRVRCFRCVVKGLSKKAYRSVMMNIR